MKKALLAAILFSMVVASVPGRVLAFDETQSQSQRPDSGFEERKARMLHRLDERRACIQAAQNFQDLGACQDKFGRPNRQGGPAGGRGEGGQD